MIKQVDARPPSLADVPSLLPHLSWTAIRIYNDCPRSYAFKYFEGLPEERVASARIFGIAMHRAAIEEVFGNRMAGRGLPGISRLMKIYAKAWRQETARAPEVHFAQGESPIALAECAERMLAAFLSYLDRDASCNEVLAIEKPAVIRLTPDTPPLHARIDLAEREGRNLLITDLKTSRSRWNDAKVLENQPQLLLYAAAGRHLFGALGFKAVRTRFWVITKTKTPSIQVIEPQIDAGATARLRDLVQESWRGIQARAFPRREGWACASCAYRIRCLGR